MQRCAQLLAIGHHRTELSDAEDELRHDGVAQLAQNVYDMRIAGHAHAAGRLEALGSRWMQSKHSLLLSYMALCCI